MARSWLRRGLALLCCACFAAVCIMVSALLIAHAGHVCAAAQQCPGCVQIRAAQAVLKQLLTAYAVAVAAFAVPFACERLRGQISPTAPFTPVSLKIRMNN